MESRKWPGVSTRPSNLIAANGGLAPALAAKHSHMIKTHQFISSAFFAAWCA